MINCTCEACGGKKMTHGENACGFRIILVCINCQALAYIYWLPARKIIWPHKRPANMPLGAYITECLTSVPPVPLQLAAAA